MSQPELEKKLQKIKHPSFFADVIRQNPAESIPMIKDQLRDGNRKGVKRIIGKKLVEAIEQL
jgi:hypothetical protein